MKQLFTFLSLLLSITCLAQTKVIKTLGSNRYANVHCGLQDKAGDIWFGTTGDGVYRYNGKTFTNFTTKDGMSDNAVYSILEDRAGNIWLGTGAGVCIYNGKSFTSRSLKNTHYLALVNPLNNNKPAKDIVSAMLQDKSGTIWLSTTQAVYCYDGKTFTRFLDNDGVINKNGLHLNSVQNILQDKKGNIWFTTWFEGLCVYDGKSITNFKPNGEVWFGGLLEDKEGNIWVGRRGKGVSRYDGKTFTNIMQKGMLDSCAVSAMLQDRQGNIWFGTEASDMTKRETTGGLWRYDGRSFKNFTTKDGLPNNAVFCALEDKAGNIWIGTRNTGLCLYDGKAFTRFSE